jgi:hypothetical protein
MKELGEQARMAANVSQFKSNYVYCWQSVHDGFIEGYKAASNDIINNNPYCPYCGQFKKMPGTGMQVQLCMCGTEPMKGKELEILQKTAKRLLSDKPTKLRK